MNVHLLALALAVGLAGGVSASAAQPASVPAPVRPGPAGPAGPVGTVGPVGTIPGGCMAVPHACGYPDATNTGVPAGTTLRSVPGQISSGPGWHYDPRGWVEVDGNGAVLSGLSIPCNLDISASDVTIKDVRVEASGQSSFGISLRNTSNVTIEHSTIEGHNPGAGRLMVGIKDIFGNSTGTTVLDNDISRAATGVQIYQGLIRGNYIHDMGFIAGDHINGITVSGGITPLTIQGNTILVESSQTDAISLFQDTGVEANKVIKGNLLAGGGYAIYGGEATGGQPAWNIVIEDNRIGTHYYSDGGFYGAIVDFTPTAGNVWSANVWDDTGLPILSP